MLPYIKFTCKPKQAKIVTLNGKPKEIVTSCCKPKLEENITLNKKSKENLILPN